MIYTGPMAIRTAIFGLPTSAVVGMVLSLNSLNASAGIAAAALGVVAVSGGAALGYFAHRLPAVPGGRRAHRLAPRHGGR